MYHDSVSAMLLGHRAPPKGPHTRRVAAEDERGKGSGIRQLIRDHNAKARREEKGSWVDSSRRFCCQAACDASDTGPPAAP